MLLKIVYVLTCRILGLVTVLCRGGQAAAAEVLVLRHENAVLRRQAGRVRYEPADRAWSAALARIVSRRRRAEVFPVTPATLLVFQAAGTRILLSAVQAPRMNAICERLAGTLRREILDRTLILGQAHLRAVLAEYQTRYNGAGPHQAIRQQVPDGDRDTLRVTLTDLDIGRIRRRRILGGLIDEYTHAAGPIENPQATEADRIFERHNRRKVLLAACFCRP